MTQPSAMLDAMVLGLSTYFEVAAPSAEDPILDVRVVDDASIEDVTEYLTVSRPAVLLSCLGGSQGGSDVGLMTLEAQWLARCYARLSPGTELVRSRGDLAADIAALVACAVENNLWPDEDGTPCAFSRPSRIGISNRSSRALASRGLSLWLVTWNQPLQLTPRDAQTTLHALTTMGITLAMGGALTPDAEAELELEGGTP